MFDFAGSEIALVAVVALILIGPKDLPVAIKAVTGVIKKARRMASEFQVHVDDMMKDADLGDLKSGLSELRRMDIKGKILNAIDDDGGIRKSMTEVNSSASGWTPPPAPVPAVDPLPTTAVAALPEHTIGDLAGVPGHDGVHVYGDPAPAAAVASAAPAFIPPRAARTAPAFIPPGAAHAAPSSMPLAAAHAAPSSMPLGAAQA